MGIPETKIIEGQVYNKVKEYPNFVLYRNKNGISECFGYFELQQKNQQGKYYKGNLIKKLYRKYGEILSKEAIKDIVNENDAEKSEQIAKLIYEDEKIYN